jgi:hypothetical protein
MHLVAMKGQVAMDEMSTWLAERWERLVGVTLNIGQSVSSKKTDRPSCLDMKEFKFQKIKNPLTNRFHQRAFEGHRYFKKTDLLYINSAYFF